MGYLLDTNIVTAHLKDNKRITNKLREISRQRKEVFISCFTYYEVKRGLLAVNAPRKIFKFNEFCLEVRVLFLMNIEIIEKASEIYAALKRNGTPIQDVDILIAATAITQGLIVVSDDSDLLRVENLTVENWLRTES